MKVVPIILSGGAGSRLWPASSRPRPKQLLDLVDERSMFLTTLHRAAALPDTGPPMIVSNADQRAGIERELAESDLGAVRMILEPVGRNTAPALAVAALDLDARNEDPLLLVLPADHVIRDEARFSEAVVTAAHVAEAGHLVTFGITPTRAETGYGYIEAGEDLGNGAMTVNKFTEKPDAATAAAYVNGGRHLWNSGMFMFRASRYLDELEEHRPEVLDAARAALSGAKDEGSTVLLDAEAMERAPSVSIDYAVMEPTRRAAVVPLDAGWTDVGSWAALWEIGKRDADGNVLSGATELIDVTNSYIRSDGRLVAVIGLDGVAVVETPDAVLVAPMDRVQDVKQIVERLQKEEGA